MISNKTLTELVAKITEWQLDNDISNKQLAELFDLLVTVEGNASFRKSIQALRALFA